MATAKDFSLYWETTEKFVNLCATTFGWGDLSQDTLMDLGCGKELSCSKTVLENFPNVKSIIALDADPAQIERITFKSPRITRLQADILKKTDIRAYEGKIDKVISTHLIHQIPNKTEVFKNVYRLLKPGGEAAFLLTADLGLYHVLKALKKDTKYKDYFKGSLLFELYSSELKADNYREMLRKIGFKVIEIVEEKDNISNTMFGICERNVVDAVAHAFSVPPELVHDINSSAVILYRTMYCEKNSVYTSTDMSIFVTKPTDADTKVSSS